MLYVLPFDSIYSYLNTHHKTIMINLFEFSNIFYNVFQSFTNWSIPIFNAILTSNNITHWTMDIDTTIHACFLREMGRSGKLVHLRTYSIPTVSTQLVSQSMTCETVLHIFFRRS